MSKICSVASMPFWVATFRFKNVLNPKQNRHWKWNLDFARTDLKDAAAAYYYYYRMFWAIFIRFLLIWWNYDFQF